MKDFDRVRVLIKAKDVKAALALIDRIESENGSSARLLVLKALCLQLSDNAAPEDVVHALNGALLLDDEYVDAHLEMGWFHLVMLDDAEGAKISFGRAMDLLTKLNQEVVRGLLACDQELMPDIAPEIAKIQYQDALVRAEPDAAQNQ